MKRRKRSKFRVDRVAEELITRLSTLEVGSDEQMEEHGGDRLRSPQEEHGAEADGAHGRAAQDVLRRPSDEGRQ